MNKEDIKDRNRLELALDHETKQLISFIAYNWDAAASRMEQIANEREQRRYDDDGTEAMAVFCRLERVLNAIFALNGRPQAVLLSYHCAVRFWDRLCCRMPYSRADAHNDRGCHPAR